MDARRTFNTVADRLLDGRGMPDEKHQAANDLFALLNELGGRPHDATGAAANPWQRESLLLDGKALNPYSAATCLLDHARTSAFSRGLHDAIAAARNRFSGERIDVLYAGTGPFAPLALLQTTAFSADEVAFTLLDIHQPALECLAEIISALAVGDYVDCYVQADATAWTPPETKTYHVVVAEVMEKALTSEPQVAVTMHLAKFMRAGGFFVPESVELSLCLLDPATEHNSNEEDEVGQADRTVKRERVMVGTPFTLTRANAEKFSMTEERHIRLQNVQLPSNMRPDHQLSILTRIHTFGEILLDEYDSGLTHPQAINGIAGLKPAMSLVVWYALGKMPGLHVGPASSGEIALHER